jgi:hypothetical protein
MAHALVALGLGVGGGGVAVYGMPGVVEIGVDVAAGTEPVAGSGEQPLSSTTETSKARKRTDAFCPIGRRVRERGGR